MWAQACDLLDQAERMHRQFFRLAAAGQTRIAWEPPVDILEDDRNITIIVALPGVPAECVEIADDQGTLVVRATRRMPFSGAAAVMRRIEIPYGVFERRIPLPQGGLDKATRELLNGCLILTLRKAKST
jgi:HSP20 family molecular chaperone IbpA